MYQVAIISRAVGELQKSEGQKMGAIMSSQEIDVEPYPIIYVCIFYPSGNKLDTLFSLAGTIRMRLTKSLVGS